MLESIPYCTFKLLSVRIGGIRTFCLHPRHIELCLAEFGVQSKCSCFSKLENNRSKDHGTETSLDVIIRASLSIESKSCHGVCFAWMLIGLFSNLVAKGCNNFPNVNNKKIMRFPIHFNRGENCCPYQTPLVNNCRPVAQLQLHDESSGFDIRVFSNYHYSYYGCCLTSILI